MGARAGSFFRGQGLVWLGSFSKMKASVQVRGAPSSYI